VEDKAFELLTKIYSEMKDQFTAVNSRIDNLQTEVKTIGNQVAKFENEIKPKVEAAAMAMASSRIIVIIHNSTKSLRFNIHHLHHIQKSIDAASGVAGLNVQVHIIILISKVLSVYFISRLPLYL